MFRRLLLKAGASKKYVERRIPRWDYTNRPDPLVLYREGGTFYWDPKLEQGRDLVEALLSRKRRWEDSKRSLRWGPFLPPAHCAIGDDNRDHPIFLTHDDLREWVKPCDPYMIERPTEEPSIDYEEIAEYERNAVRRSTTPLPVGLNIPKWRRALIGASKSSSRRRPYLAKKDMN